MTSPVSTADSRPYDDLLRPDILRDPYPVYDTVREAEPVWWNPHLDAWLLLRHDDVLDALGRPELFSSDRTTAFLGHLDESEEERFRAWADMRRRMMLYNDPPRHTRLRRPVQRGMSVRLAQQMRPKIQRVVDELVDDVIERGACDGIQDLGYHLPVILNSELIGIPEPDRQKVKGWTADFVAAINAGGANVPVTELERGQNAILAMREYFTELGARKRAEPQEDLLSSLVSRDQDPLEGDDLVATCIVVMFAGLETALNLVGNGLLALLRNPDQLDLLIARPELMPSAVEEFLRYDGPLHLVGRMATEDVTLRGRTIARGDKVLVMLGAANRDGAAYTDPHRLDITRQETRHLSFSHGIHYCPGAEISRIMGELSFGTILTRMRDLRLGDGELEWQPNLSFRGLRRLPLEFTPGPRTTA
ncbi:cytochrome P450 [Streptomyces sp. TRM70308]|uniref:cytochrome P450 n=1 Tax=Streptomyces sp. TRM70308 TaxID=3131932 RepID=UPI003CFCC88E